VERPVILCGLGRVGWRVLESLLATKQPVVVVDTNPPPDDPRLANVTVVKGDCRDLGVLERAGVKDARGVLILTSDDLVNVSAALLVRRLNADVRVVVRMFNQNLMTRLGAAVKNMVAASVSGLIAPLLALTAVTGDALGAFKLDSGPQQVSDLVVTDGELVGRRIDGVAAEHKVVPLAFTRDGGEPLLLQDVPPDATLAVGDHLVVSGAPHDLDKLLARLRGDLLPGVRWAGTLRRWFRTAKRTLREVDLAVKIIVPVLFVVLFASTLVFHYGFGMPWGNGLYETVTVVATGSDLHGADRPEWAKVFLSVLKLAGAALIAAFTAILTNYLIRAKLGGALEVRRVPDGGHVVVCGLGNVGFRVVEELHAIGERVVAIDKVNDNPFIATTRRKGVPAFVGDATIPEVLRQARVDTAKAVIACTSSELANFEIALLVREIKADQRVVVRLSDPQFAETLRVAADVKFAMSVPALAAPAFAAALFGDRVQTLVRVAGRTLVVVEFTVSEGDEFICARPLPEVMAENRFLPLAVAGQPPEALRDYRLKPGDRLTAVAELQDLERLLRRETASTKGES
jgi:Trk K+ transport system NAD-binding subunit